MFITSARRAMVMVVAVIANKDLISVLYNPTCLHVGLVSSINAESQLLAASCSWGW